MTIITIIITVIFLIVIYSLFTQNKALLNNPAPSKLQNELDQELEEEIDSQSIDLTNYILKNRITSKREAIDVVNMFVGRNQLSNSNTNFSSLNKAKPVWWFDINAARFSKDLHLILAKQKGFIWIIIPKSVVINPSKTFYIRKDNGLVQLVISAESGFNYLRDTKGSYFNFEHYIEKEFD